MQKKEKRIIIAVGSKNPTKVDPVKKIFKHHFKNVNVVGVEVETGVKDQPTSDDELFTGAKNRAKKALSIVKNAKYGVGIEGGIHKYSYGWLERAIIVIIDKKGNIGIGSSGGIVLPNHIVDRLHKGENLTQVIDDLFGTRDIGKGIGMFGIFTKGVVDRTKAYEQGVAFAISRFLHEDLYES